MKTCKGFISYLHIFLRGYLYENSWRYFFMSKKLVDIEEESEEIVEKGKQLTRQGSELSWQGSELS